MEAPVTTTTFPASAMAGLYALAVEKSRHENESGGGKMMASRSGS